MVHIRTAQGKQLIYLREEQFQSPMDGGIFQLGNEVKYMKHIHGPINVLHHLVYLELDGITFIKDYIQFLFGESVLNTVTLPRVKVHDVELSFNQTGYYDLLCTLIGKVVVEAYVNEETMFIKFGGEAEITVSLKEENRVTAEAVMFKLDSKGKWNIW